MWVYVEDRYHHVHCVFSAQHTDASYVFLETDTSLLKMHCSEIFAIIIIASYPNMHDLIFTTRQRFI